MVADTSRGTGKDYHAFTIINITSAPYSVAATFRNNILPPAMFPTAIVTAAKQYNNAWLLVELNDIGGQVADIIHEELEYDGLLQSSVKGRKVRYSTEDLMHKMFNEVSKPRKLSKELVAPP